MPSYRAVGIPKVSPASFGGFAQLNLAFFHQFGQFKAQWIDKIASFPNIGGVVTSSSLSQKLAALTRFWKRVWTLKTKVERLVPGFVGTSE